MCPNIHGVPYCWTLRYRERANMQMRGETLGSSGSAETAEGGDTERWAEDRACRGHTGGHFSSSLSSSLSDRGWGRSSSLPFLNASSILKHKKTSSTVL